MIVNTTRQPLYSVEGLTRTQIGWLIVLLRNTFPTLHSHQHIEAKGREFAHTLMEQCEQEVKL